MFFRLQPIGKELRDAVAAKFTRRQADVMNNQQRDGCSFRTFVAVRRSDKLDAAGAADTVTGILQHAIGSDPHDVFHGCFGLVILMDIKLTN